MKAKVIIENGKTSISLTPENAFEKDVIEKAYRCGERFNIITNVHARLSYGSYDNHRIDLDITEAQ